MSNKNDMGIPFTVKTPLNYTVTCSVETWDGHIVKGHNIMENNAHIVYKTLENPDVVYESEEHPDTRDVFFKRENISLQNEKSAVLCQKVVIEKPINEYSNGSVVSAWPQKDIKGGIGKLKYVKPKF